jgi:hypothetical protein
MVPTATNIRLEANTLSALAAHLNGRSWGRTELCKGALLQRDGPGSRDGVRYRPVTAI